MLTGNSTNAGDDKNTLENEVWTEIKKVLMKWLNLLEDEEKATSLGLFLDIAGMLAVEVVAKETSLDLFLDIVALWSR